MPTTTYPTVPDNIIRRPNRSGSLTGPCSYTTAHLRLYDRRGSASQYVCPCGKQAREWAYNHRSKQEQTGERRVHRSQGRISVQSSAVWSGNPADYDALCTRCHRILDRTFN